MPALLANCVLETCNNPGTGTLQLQGAAPGRESFLEGFGNGVQAYYFLTDGTQTEAGVGTVIAGSPNTLSRDTVIWNSVGTTAKLSFTGSCQVFSDLPAERSPLFSADNATLPMGGRRLAALAAGTAADDAPRLDQVGWRSISQTLFSTAQTGAAFSLPAGFERFRVELQDVVPAANAALYVRYSFDGGVTYASGTSDYSYATADARAGSATFGGATQSYIPICAATAADVIGALEFQPAGNKRVLFDAASPVSGGLSRWTGCGSCAVAGRATHVLVSGVGVNLASGRLRLLGAPA